MTVPAAGSVPPSAKEDTIASTWLQGLPKVELHLHLEGAIPPGALWDLCRKYGGDPATPTFEAFTERFRYRDFSHFIEVWLWKNGFLREPEDFTMMAEAVARTLADQNVLYAEAFFSPADFSRHGLVTQEIAAAIRGGLDRVPEVEVALIADLVRDHGADRAAVTLGEAEEARGEGIIGIGLGGSEAEFPAPLFEDVFKQAQAASFRTTAHSGEADGPESVWSTIRALAVDRIGHGTRAEEDLRLVEKLAERRVPLEMCPISNVRTGVVGSIAEHPIRRFVDQGLLVTVSTDDPAMFQTSLAQEYEALMSDLGFRPDEIRRLILNAVEASWLSHDEKARLAQRIVNHTGWGAEREG